MVLVSNERKLELKFDIRFISIEFAVENVKYQESLESNLYEFWQCYQMLLDDLESAV